MLGAQTNGKRQSVQATEWRRGICSGNSSWFVLPGVLYLALLSCNGCADRTAACWIRSLDADSTLLAPGILGLVPAQWTAGILVEQKRVTADWTARGSTCDETRTMETTTAQSKV
jgi:hypothetical protein